MWFGENMESIDAGGADRRPMMQKDIFPVNAAFKEYLQRHGRDMELPVLYSDLANYSYADSVRDKKGKWTHWENAVYEPAQLEVLNQALVKTYKTLKKQDAGGQEFDIERVDFCDYGNSVPFRIKVVEKRSGEADFFYIKQADASRIYGLELEHLLTQNRINFLHHQATLVEEHIEGIPGDIFLQQDSKLTTIEKIGIAKAFVQFNESCFVRLLGDMRSYNFVINPVLLNGNTTYQVRAIDFDQQSYEGKKILYFPKFYKENLAYTELVMKNLDPVQIEQSRQAEFKGMAQKIITHRRQLMELLNSMVNDDLSENYKVQILKNQLNEHFGTTRFSSCKTMGAIVKHQLKQVLQIHVKMAITK